MSISALTGHIESVNIGQVESLPFHSGSVRCAIRKQPLDSPAWVSHAGIDGDAQADRENHGGPDKAVCVYPFDHYPYWSRRLERELGPGAFGENLTTSRLVESVVCIGDLFQIGEALLQVSQPRQPCFKLAARYGIPRLALWVQETGFTGFYLRVLRPGWVTDRSRADRVRRPHRHLTVHEANRLMHSDKHDVEGMKSMLGAAELSASWRRTYTARLEGLTSGDPAKRLYGSAVPAR